MRPAFLFMATTLRTVFAVVAINKKDHGYHRGLFATY
jgi:hypothetical protein